MASFIVKNLENLYQEMNIRAVLVTKISLPSYRLKCFQVYCTGFETRLRTGNGREILSRRGHFCEHLM